MVLSFVEICEAPDILSPALLDTQVITGTTSLVTAAATTVCNLSKSAWLAVLRPPHTLPPATCTAAWLLTTAASLQYAGGEQVSAPRGVRWKYWLSFTLPPSLSPMFRNTMLLQPCSAYSIACGPRRQNWNGQLGSGSFDVSSVPIQVAGENNHFVSLCAGYAHTCGLLAGYKRVACFGEDPAPVAHDGAPPYRHEQPMTHTLLPMWSSA